jgi:hypothetical protein
MGKFRRSKNAPLAEMWLRRNGTPPTPSSILDAQGAFSVENASIRTGAMVNLYEAWAGADRQAGPSPPAKDDVKRRISRLLGSIPLIFADSTKEHIWRRIEIIDIFI